MSRLSVVVGGQFGSEGKGAICAYLAATAWGPVHNVRVAGPNAGHTVIGTGPNGERDYPWRLRAVPVGAVSRTDSRLYVAAGSEVDYSVLDSELNALDAAGFSASDRLVIDREATVLEEHHIKAETGMHETIGSTGKGIGAARSDRIMRNAALVGGAVDTSASLRRALIDDENVLIEGTQGYGLGLHAGFYPQCTSSDCRAIDFLAMVGISPWEVHVDDFEVWVVARTYPIRVAGNSGPLKGETSWDALGLAEERTTVTQKVRRVGEWDADLVGSAVVANGGTPVVRLALTMFDYIFPELANQTNIDLLEPRHLAYLANLERETGAPIKLIGTGPASIMDLR